MSQLEPYVRRTLLWGAAVHQWLDLRITDTAFSVQENYSTAEGKTIRVPLLHAHPTANISNSENFILFIFALTVSATTSFYGVQSNGRREARTESVHSTFSRRRTALERGAHTQSKITKSETIWGFMGRSGSFFVATKYAIYILLHFISICRLHV